MSKSLVVITGASAGIGAALARVYAETGWDLILTARREAVLSKLADEIRADHGSDVVVIPEDLADPEAPERLVRAIAARGLTVDGPVRIFSAFAVADNAADNATRMRTCRGPWRKRACVGKKAQTHEAPSL